MIIMYVVVDDTTRLCDDALCSHIDQHTVLSFDILTADIAQGTIADEAYLVPVG